MIINLEKYNGKFKIVSLAFDEKTKTDLLENDLDVIFISEDEIRLYPDDLLLSDDKNRIGQLSKAHNYDVYALWENGRLSTYYDGSSIDNYFFVTAKCNSNCIMCPSPDLSRQQGGSTHVDHLIEIARHIPSDASHLTITGGEPFLIGQDIFRFLEFLRDKFEYTEFLFLTNGRIFAIDSYVQRFAETCPQRSLVAIPIHGSNAKVHDAITQAEASFDQTVLGIRKLLKAGIHIELRIVVSQMNAHDLNNIALLIASQFPNVEYVSMIAMEMTGSARTNQEKVWISYRQAAQAAAEASMILLKNGIDVKLYNFPLCTVKRELWTLCEKSISANKVRYGQVCRSCKVKNACGGVFAGTMSFEEGELRAAI